MEYVSQPRTERESSVHLMNRRNPPGPYCLILIYLEAVNYFSICFFKTLANFTFVREPRYLPSRTACWLIC